MNKVPRHQQQNKPEREQQTKPNQAIAASEEWETHKQHTTDSRTSA